MGIKGLAKAIANNADEARTEKKFENYFGKTLAIDASVSIYQFLTKVRTQGDVLKAADGSTTSHISGSFYRVIKLLRNGIKPIFVFDGKAPDLKSFTLEKRKEALEKNQEMLEQAQKEGDFETANILKSRTVKMSKEHIDDLITMYRLMGIPTIIAPCEAEAQCAELVKSGIAYGAVSEDMDTLCFGCSKMIRNMFSSAAKNLPIVEFNLEKTLQVLQFTYDMFIDYCILLGCDYCPSIKNVGPAKALSLIKQHHTIEKILESSKAYEFSSEYDLETIRNLFRDHPVTKFTKQDLEWKTPDKEGLIEFMVHEKGFNIDTVEKNFEKIMKAKKDGCQTTMDRFFKPGNSVVSSTKGVKNTSTNTKKVRKRKAK